MPCIPDITKIANIQYDCNLAFGGLKSVEFRNGEKVFEIEFNDRDGVTSYEETKTASPDGITSCIQVLTIEHPHTKNLDKIAAFANPNMKFTVKAITKSGKVVNIGSSFGASLKTSTLNSGASRQEKSSIQLVFQAEEEAMSTITAPQAPASQSDVTKVVVNETK